MKIFDIFLIFAYTMRCGSNEYHNLCFGAKIRNLGIPLHTAEAVLTRTHNLCLEKKNKKNIKKNQQKIFNFQS